MKAWTLTQPGHPLQLVDRKNPDPGEGQIVIEVHAAGICHSDIGLIDGIIPAGSLPLVLGHETAGLVTAIGPGGTTVAVGDRVVSIADRPAPAGETPHIPGWTVDGGYATCLLTSADGVLSLPDQVSFAQGAVATDAGSTAFDAVVTAIGLTSGMRVGIIGLGGLGMTGARIAVVRGATVFAAEPRTAVWDIARDAGVEHITTDVLELDGLGLDAVVDFAGFGTTTNGAIHVVKPGGIVAQVGLGVTTAVLDTAELVSKAIVLRGVRGGGGAGTAEVLTHMNDGHLQIPVTEVPFNTIPEALEELRAGRVVGRLVAVPHHEGHVG